MKRGKCFAPALAGWMLLSSFIILLWSIQAEAMVVWTDHATVKIRREITLTPPKTGQVTATLKAAKNEFESFQLIVSADQGNLAGVNVTVSDLTSGSSLIPSSAIMIYKEVFMNITTRSTIEGGVGYWPDALIPKKDGYVGEVRNAFPFSVLSGRNQPVWIEIYIPQTAGAGVYRGSATVTATNQTTVVVPIELTVWNFALPSTSSLKSAYSIDYHLIPLGHQLGYNYMNQLDLIKSYGKANLLHRITGDFLPGPQALSGGWDAWAGRFGSLLNGTEPFLGGRLPGAKMTTYRMSFSGHETDVAFLKNIAQNAEKRGWLDRLFQYTFDEPKPTQPAQWQTIKNRVTALHQADPRLRALVTASIQGASDFGLTQCATPRRDPCIDLFSPTIRFMDNKLTGRTPGGEIPGGANTAGNQRSKYGPEVWWYQACGSHGCGILGGGPSDPSGYHTGWPAYLIDLPAMFNRIMQWQSFKYNVQGELYYDMVYAYGQRDPWVSQFDFAGNGDGTLYYPGTPAKIGGTRHIPIESIRLKLLREGMEDYEYMHLLERLGDDSYADRQVANVITRTYIWSRDPQDLYFARENMALQILFRLGSGGPIPPPPPSFTDSFDRANATTLGLGWDEYLADFEIFNNQLRNKDAKGQEAQHTKSIGPDQNVSVSCKTTIGANSCGVIARWSNANNFYYALIDPGQGSIALLKRVNGVFTRLARVSRPMSYHIFYQIRLVTQGTSLRVFVNGESTAAITLNDASLVSGNYAGIRSYATAAATTYFENFKASPL